MRKLQIPKDHPHKFWLTGPVVEVQFLFVSSHSYPDSDDKNTILVKILLQGLGGGLLGLLDTKVHTFSSGATCNIYSKDSMQADFQ